MKKTFTAIALASMLSAAHAQNVGLVRNGTNIVTGTNATLALSNALAWPNSTNAATTRTGLGLGASWLLAADRPASADGIWDVDTSDYGLTVNQGYPNFYDFEYKWRENLGFSSAIDGLLLATNYTQARTSLFSTGGVPSGGAAEGSVYTVVGNQYVGVASRATTARLTNNSFRTNTSDQNATNNNEAQLTVSLDADSLYRITFRFVTTSAGTGGFGFTLMSSLSSTNAGQMLGLYNVIRGSRPNFTALDFGFTSFGGTQFGAVATAVSSAFTNSTWAGTGNLFTGSSNQSITVRWYQGTTNTNVTTLHSNSLIQVEKLWP
jgi:hypothetical protein